MDHLNKGHYIQHLNNIVLYNYSAMQSIHYTEGCPSLGWLLRGSIIITHFSMHAVHSQSECPPRKPGDKTSPSYYILSGHGTRPRMGHRQMFRRTKRAWQALPEVRRRVEEERKRAQAETNRLRVKLYQKVG